MHQPPQQHKQQITVRIAVMDWVPCPSTAPAVPSTSATPSAGAAPLELLLSMPASTFAFCSRTAVSQRPRMLRDHPLLHTQVMAVALYCPFVPQLGVAWPTPADWVRPPPKRQARSHAVAFAPAVEVVVAAAVVVVPSGAFVVAGAVAEAAPPASLPAKAASTLTHVFEGASYTSPEAQVAIASHLS